MFWTSQQKSGVSILEYNESNYFQQICASPYIDHWRVPRNIIKESSNICKFIISAIHEGYYVYHEIDMNYLAFYNYSKEWYWSRHPTTIYGYDTDKEIFNIADFTGGEYTFGTARYDEIEKSFDNFHTSSLLDDGSHMLINQKLRNCELYQLIP